MPARGYSTSAPRKKARAKPKPSTAKLQASVNAARREVRAGRGPRADTRDVTRGTRPDTRKLRADVAKARRKVKAGTGVKAETGDVTKGTAQPTLAERRRSIGAQFPSGRQSTLGQILHGQSEATRRRDEALRAFDQQRVTLKPGTKPDTPITVTDLTSGKHRKVKARDLGLDRTPEQRAAQAAEAGSKSREERSEKRAELAAPAIKVLNETLRPVRAVAGAADEVVRGRPAAAPAAAARGLIKNKGPLFSDVLKHAGAGDKTAAVAGLALDVALDPTTYLTVGANVPAKAAAASAAKAATREALQKGASKKAADRAGRAAAKKTLADPKLQNKGLTIGARAKVPFTKKPQLDVKTSGRTTAAISRATGASKVATKVRETRPVQALGESLVPDFRPKGVSPREHRAIRSAQLELRAATGTARRVTERETAALRKAIPDQKTAERIIDHIESGRPLKELGEHAETARAIRRMTGETFDAKKAARLIDQPYRPRGPEESARYLPRIRRQDLEPGRLGTIKGHGRKPKPETERKFRQPLAKLRESHPALFSEDLPATVASHREAGRVKVAQAQFWDKVAKSGRPLNKQTAQDIDLGREMVFKVTPRGLEPLVKEGGEKVDLDAIGKALKGGPDKHVVLDWDNYERLAKSTGDTRTPGGRAFDAVQGRWKTLVTVPMPGYHARNLMGDTLNAFMADTTAHAYAQSVKVMKSRVARNKAERSKLASADTSPKITVGGRTLTHRQLLREAEQHGVIDQGFIAKELPYETGKKTPGKFSRAVQYREDAPRMATYISALERGMKPSEAAQWANKHHFDYGDLTTTERALRRGIPFYTFFARNTRLQATKVLTRPGKQATLAKVMEETAKAAGFSDYESYAENLPDYQQRGLPIPIKMGDKVTSWTYMPPSTDLNALSTKPKDAAQNIAQRLTAAKLVGELYANYSIFFQGPIEREGAKLVPAPKILGELPAAVRKRMGVQQFRDKRRGLIWGWPAKVDYVARQLPESNLLVQQLTPAPGSREQSAAQTRIGALTGVKPTTYADVVEDERIRDEAKKLHDLTSERNNLLRTPAAKDEFGYASPKLVGLRAQIKAQEDKVTRLREKRGDDVAEQRLEAPPLTPAQEAAQEIKEFRESASPSAVSEEIRKEIEDFRREQAYLRKKQGR